MANYIATDTDLTAVADAIREKGGTSAPLTFPAGFVSAVEAIETGGGGGLQWELIGEETRALEEWTATTAQNVDTGINVKNTDYVFCMVVITCDTPITTSTEWGMTVGIFGRFKTSGNSASQNIIQQLGTATLSFSVLSANTNGNSGYGVSLAGNSPTVSIVRKCNATICPKIRAGNYTVKAYGLKSI